VLEAEFVSLFIIRKSLRTNPRILYPDSRFQIPDSRFQIPDSLSVVDGKICMEFPPSDDENFFFRFRIE
jgi:hypothetical protein